MVRLRQGVRTAIIVSSVFVLAFAARNGRAADDKQVTLSFANWAAAEATTRPAIEQVVKDFEQAHPNIRIKSEAISFSEIARQLVLRVRSGNPPDVAQLAGNDTLLVAATGRLEPLERYVGADLKARLKPEALNGLTYKGELIAFPWTQAPAGLWYDKAVMSKAGLNPDKPPQTIDELMADMAAVKKSQPDVIPLALDTTNRPFSLQSNWPWMQTFGAAPIGGAGADSPAMKQYLAWMRELSQKGYIDPGRKIGEFRPLAAQDKVAFIWDQVLLQGVVQSASKMSDADFYARWGVATQPVGPSGRPRSFEGGHQLVIFADSKQKQAAWEFVQYLATSPVAIRTYTLGPGASLPPLSAKGDAELMRGLGTPIFKTFTEKIAPTVSSPPFGPAFATASTAIMAGVQEAVSGSTPIDEIATSMQQQLSRQ